MIFWAEDWQSIERSESLDPMYAYEPRRLYIGYHDGRGRFEADFIPRHYYSTMYWTDLPNNPVLKSGTYLQMCDRFDMSRYVCKILNSEAYSGLEPGDVIKELLP